MRSIVYAVLVAALVGVMAPPAGAGGATVCAFRSEVVVSPGLSTAESTGDSTSDGETGTMECDGWVDGKQPTGPGTFGFAGRYGTAGPDTCASGGEGDGVQSFTIPTRQGPVELANRLSFSYRESAGGVISGRFHGDQLTGTFEIVPLEGDCSKTPVTRMVIRGEGTLRGAWAPRGGEGCGGSAVSA